MRLLFVNPNATEAMTETIAAAAREAAPEGVEVTARTNLAGPPAIQGEADGAAALPGLLALVEAGGREGFDAIVIACFDDTGLELARELVPCPVLGIGQAGYLAATLLGRRWSVVTTLPVSVPILEGNIAAYGLAGLCGRVRASGVPVLEVEQAEAAVAAEAARAVAEDGAGTIVLGCAGMAGLTGRMAAGLGVPVIDGVAAAAQLAVAAARLAPSRRESRAAEPA